ncbi:energy transducer TonB [Novosphingobium resinovorum]|uniref:energy transducer TonB n=1 Tax=Novosphingobium resinovorum TaxID=158500 RepID=UPI002ED2C04E|nr:energy transducer TonB [Novosphingobium resinovorum]
MAYRQSPADRLRGLSITLLLHVCAGGALLVGWSFAAAAPPLRDPLTVIDLAAPASPPQPERDTRKDAPEPVEQQDPSPPVPRRIEVPQAAVTLAPPLPAARPVEATPPRPAQAEAAAPKAIEAPPAATVSSNAPDSWEGRVLARLASRKRYPGTARARREQGVVWVRITMDRKGRVLSAVLAQGSGSAGLDREALALPRRADPLPEPPKERGGETLDLVVPVEFMLPR